MMRIRTYNEKGEKVHNFKGINFDAVSKELQDAIARELTEKYEEKGWKVEVYDDSEQKG